MRAFNWPTPQDGQQFVDIGNTVFGRPLMLSQTFTVPGAGLYQVGWYDGSGIYSGEGGAPYTVSVLDAANQPIAGASLDSYHGGDWVGRSLTANLAPGSYTLAFTNGNGILDTLLDNVSVAPVPEPSAGMLLVVGLVAFAGGHFAARRSAVFRARV